MPAPSLPPLFFLRIRRDSGDVFVLLRSKPVGSTWELDVEPKGPLHLTTYTVADPVGYNWSPEYLGKYTIQVKGPEPTTVERRVYIPVLPLITGALHPVLAHKTTGELVPVLEFQHSGIFKGRRLVPNCIVSTLGPTTYYDASGNLMDATTLSVVAEPFHTPSSPTPTPVPIPMTPTTPTPKKSRLPTLSLHAARQLLELAQLKKEQCPVTVEDYITGQTAVMPCGHLFMQIAIEESFKKDPNLCPWCRQTGVPTFV